VGGNGRAIGTVVGGIVGFAAGGNVAIGAYIGGTIGGYVDQQLTVSNRAQGLIDLTEINAQRSSYSIPIPVVYGTFRLAGNIIWANTILKERGPDGAERLMADFAVAICRGEISGITRIWDGETLLTDLRQEGRGTDNEGYEYGRGGGIDGVFDALRVYRGTDSQLPDSLISTYPLGRFGSASLGAPAFRDLAYVVFERYRIDDGAGNAKFPDLTFEVSTNATGANPWESLPIIPTVPEPVIPDENSTFVWQFTDFTSQWEFAQKSTADFTGSNIGAVGKWVGVQPNGASPQMATGATNSTTCYCTIELTINSMPNIGWSMIALTMTTGLNQKGILGINADGTLEVFDSTGSSVAASTATVPTGEIVRIDWSHSPTNTTVLINGVTAIDDVAGGTFAATAIAILGIGHKSGVLGTNPIFNASMRAAVLATVGFIPDGRVTISSTIPTFELGTDYTPTGDMAFHVPCGGDEAFGFEATFSDVFDGSGYSSTNYASRTHAKPKGLADGGSGGGGHTLKMVNQVLDVPARVLAHKVFYSSRKVPTGSGGGGCNAWVTGSTSSFVTITDYLGTASSSNAGPPGSGDPGPLSFLWRLRSDAVTSFSMSDSMTFEVENSGSYGPVFGSAGTSVLGVAPYTSGQTIDVPVEAGDDLIILDNQNWCCIHTFGRWDLVNLLTSAVDQTRTFIDENGIQLCPQGDCDFDSGGYLPVLDDGGNTTGTRGHMDLQRLWLSPWTGTSTPEGGAPVGGTDEPISNPTRVRTMSGREYGSWNAIIDTDGTRITICDLFRWYPFPSANVTVTSGFTFENMTVDNESGYFWAISNGADQSTGTSSGSPQQTEITLMIPEEGIGEVNTTVYDITSEIAGTATVIRYDEDTDQIMVGSYSPQKIAFYNLGTDSDGNITLTLDGELTTTGCVPQYAKSAWRRGAIGGFIIYADPDSNTIKSLDVPNQAVAETWTITDSGDGVPTLKAGSVYEPRGHSVISGCTMPNSSDEQEYCRIWLERGTPVAITLASIVEAISEEAGLTAAQIEASELDSTLVWGYMRPHGIRARDAIKPLTNVYFFDIVESDGQLNYLKRGRSSSVSVPEIHLAAHAHGTERPEKLTITRTNDLELPRTVEVLYIDKDKDYEQGMQKSAREITGSIEKIVIDAPVALSADEAKQLSDIVLAYAWLQRTRLAWRLPFDYIWINAADVITLTSDSGVFVPRIESMQIEDGIIGFEGVPELASVYTSDGEGVVVEPVDQQAYPGLTFPAIMDIALLRNNDDRLGIYYQMLGYTTDWLGGTIQLSRDNGSSWLDFAYSGEDDDSSIGSAVTILADVPDPWMIDKANTVQVSLFDSTDTLATVSDTDFLAGVNKAMLIDPETGDGELFYFRDVTDVGGGVYTLSYLLRGLRGTEYYTGSHVAGEMFVVIQFPLTQFTDMSVDDLGKEFLYRASSTGLEGEFSPSSKFTYSGSNLLPLSPTHIKGTRTFGDDSITLVWTPRTRIGGEWVDEYGSPSGESDADGAEYVAYEIDVYLSTTVVRTITTTAQSESYLAADQTTDGITPGDAVTFIVYQMSAIVGRGRGTTFTMPNVPS